MLNQHRLLRVFKLITLLKSVPAKSIKRLAQSLEISERSCYRYLDLLTELGFEVQKNAQHKFYLRTVGMLEAFTEEESQLLHETIAAIAHKNPLALSIQAKLPYFSETSFASQHILAAHIALMHQLLQTAIKNQQRVKIRQYQSASSESITDRIVEPIGFTPDYQSLCAYEIETHQNKYFKLDRMGNIEILEENCKFMEAHQLLKPDVFGFNDTGQSQRICLQMSMRAMLFLKADYPATADFLTEQKDGTWLLDVEVNSMEPVDRVEGYDWS